MKRYVVSAQHVRGDIYEVNGQESMLGRISANDILAAFLTVILGLNLNGLFNLLFGVNQIFSGPIFLLSVALILNVAKKEVRVSAELTLFSFAILAYLFIGSLYYSHLRSVNLPESYFRTYLSSLLVIFALSIYIGSFVSLKKAEAYFKFVKIVLILAAVSVLFSPLLYSIYSNPPPSSAYRMGGFFANPNEAAMASLLAFALVVGFPFRSRVLQALSMALVVLAVVLTFSKTGVLVVIFLGSIYLFYYSGLYLRVAYIFALLLLSLLFLEPDVALDAILENPFVEFDPSQESRVRVIFAILTGSINEDVTTGRSFLWGLSLKRIAEALPAAQGLGSMHHLIGGIQEFGVWQGAHNTFFMIVGEAGLLPLVLLITSLVFLFLRVYRGGFYVSTFLSVGFILLVDMLVTHGALGVRYHNLMLAVIFGAAILRASFRSDSDLQELSVINDCRARRKN